MRVKSINGDIHTDKGIIKEGTIFDLTPNDAAKELIKAGIVESVETTKAETIEEGVKK